MKVVLVSPLPPVRDGIATYTADLARAYRAAGHEVAFVSTTPGATLPGVLATLPRNPAAVTSALRAVLDWRPDVVHVQHAIATYGPQLPAVLSFVARLRRRGVQVVLTHHEVTRDTDKLGPAGRAYYGVLSRIASRVHVHTDGAADRLQACRYPRDRVVVYPHPVFVPEIEVDADARTRLRDRYADGRRHVSLLIGYVQVEKGHLETVQAFARLLERRPDLRDSVRLVIAGEVRRRPAGFERFERADREYEVRVRDLVSRTGLDDVVVWTGHVPEEDFDTWFHAADLVLLPYRAAEESGIAGHAIAADAPVLAARVGGLETLFGDTELALPSRDPDTFADALEQCIDDPDSRRATARRVYADLRARRSPERLTRLVLGTADEMSGS